MMLEVLNEIEIDGNVGDASLSGGLCDKTRAAIKLVAAILRW
jgi:hypothetical protein